MLSNISLIREFVNNPEVKYLQNGSMHCENDKIFSYSTCIGQWVNGGVVLNATKYSSTTSKHQHYLRKALEEAGTDYTEVYDVPRDTYSIAKYRKQNDAA